jgi:hypothetical protein
MSSRDVCGGAEQWPEWGQVHASGRRPANFRKGSRSVIGYGRWYKFETRSRSPKRHSTLRNHLAKRRDMLGPGATAAANDLRSYAEPCCAVSDETCQRVAGGIEILALAFLADSGGSMIATDVGGRS